MFLYPHQIMRKMNELGEKIDLTKVAYFGILEVRSQAFSANNFLFLFDL